MRLPLLLLAFLAVTLIGGSLLSTPLYRFGKGAAAWGEARDLHQKPVLSYLHRVAAKTKYSRYYKRSMMLCALLALYPTLRLLRKNKRPGTLPPAWQLQPERFRIRHLSLGFFLAAGLLLLMGWGLIHFEAFRMRKDPEWEDWHQALLAGVGVALLEEWLFRGLLFKLLLEEIKRLWPALLFLSLFFAFVHFLNPQAKAEIAHPDVVWNSGFLMTGSIFTQFGEFDFLLAEFSTLFMVGLVLGLARLRTRSLWLPIGLHAGWVFGLKYYSEYTKGSPDLKAGEFLPWAGVNLKIGLIPLIVICLTWALVLFCTRKSKKI